MKMRAGDARAAELFLPLAYSEEDYLFYLDTGTGALGFAFECEPQPGADPHNKERLQVLLNADWPTDTMLQVLLYAGPDIKETVDNYSILRRSQTNELLKKVVAEREKFLWQGADETIDRQSGMIVRETKLYVTASIPTADPTPSEEEIETARDMRSHLKETLANAGLAPKVMDSADYLRAMDSILSHDSDAVWRKINRRKADSDALLRDQILDHDRAIQADANGLWIGHTRVRTLSPKRMPQALRFGYAATYLSDMMSGTRGIRGRCLFACVMHFPDPRKQRDKISRDRLYTTNQALGPLVRFAPRLKRKKDGYDILNEAMENGDRPVRLMWSLSLFNDTDDESVRAASNARSYLGERGLMLLEDRFVNRAVFLNSLPLNGEVAAVPELFRFKTMATVHATALLPLFGDWKGNGPPYLTFVGRSGQLQSFDLYASNSNYNAVIAAQSGSGKSFLSNEILTNYLSAGADVRVIDIGHSYLNLCNLVDGQYLDFDESAAPCLNPYSLVENYSEEEDTLVSLVMAMSDPTGDTAAGSENYAVQTAELKRIQGELFQEHGKQLRVDHVAERCNQHDDQRVRDLGTRLYPFTSKGAYGDFFNGENNVEFSKAMTVLELEALKGRQHLQRVVLLQLIYQIQQEMYRGNRDKRRVILIDEAWEHLQAGGSAVAQFIEDCYRRARKYGGAIIMCTQTIGDLHGSSVGRAVAANSAYSFFLGQRGDTVDRAVSDGHISLSAPAVQLLKSVKTEKGRYSEIFIQAEDSVGVARLYVEPFRQVAFANDAQTPPEIRRRRKEEGMTTAEAVAAIAEDRQRKMREAV